MREGERASNPSDRLFIPYGVTVQSDDDLLGKYTATRDPIAFSELTRRYRSLVFSAARRVTGNHHDAEDITQACFVELAQQADRVTGSVAGWLYLRATSRAANTLRHGNRRRSAEKRAANAVETPLVEATWEVVSPIIDEVIERLPEELRIPVILYYLQDLSQEEIGQILRISQRTVSRRLQIGLERLRKSIGKYGIVAAAGVLSALITQNAVLACPSSVKTSLVKIGISGIGPIGVKVVPRATWKGGIGKLAGMVSASYAWQLFCILALLLSGSACLLIFGRSSPSRSLAYDTVQNSYAPWMPAGSPLAFPAKSRALSESLLSFWSGGQDLFYHWCRTHAADWLADRSSFVSCHGNIQFGCVGTYPADGRPLGAVGYGLVQFEQAASLPFQIELLQGAVTLRITAAANGIAVNPTDQQTLDNAFFDAYTAALRPAYRPANDDALLTGLFARAARRPYEHELSQYTINSEQFRRLVKGAEGGTKEALQPVSVAVRRQLAEGLAEAFNRSPQLARLLRNRDTHAIEAAMKDCVQRTHLESSATQGLAKYLILLDRPLTSGDHDLIVYLKQQIPSAAERAGAVTADPRSPAHRVADATDRSSRPGRLFNSWCNIDGRSFLLELREPFSGELDADSLRTFDQLLRAAALLGSAAGRSHANDPLAGHIARSLTSGVRRDLATRAHECFMQMRDDFESFRADDRTVRDIIAAEAALKSFKEENR